MQLQRIHRDPQYPELTSAISARPQLHTSITELPVRCIIEEISHATQDKVECSSDETSLRHRLEDYQNFTLSRLSSDFKSEMKMCTVKVAIGKVLETGASMFAVGLAMGASLSHSPTVAVCLGIGAAGLAARIGATMSHDNQRRQDVTQRQLEMTTSWASHYMHSEKILSAKPEL